MRTWSIDTSPSAGFSFSSTPPTPLPSKPKTTLALSFGTLRVGALAGHARADVRLHAPGCLRIDTRHAPPPHTPCGCRASHAHTCSCSSRRPVSRRRSGTDSFPGRPEGKGRGGGKRVTKTRLPRHLAISLGRTDSTSLRARAQRHRIPRGFITNEQRLLHAPLGLVRERQGLVRHVVLVAATRRSPRTARRSTLDGRSMPCQARGAHRANGSTLLAKGRPGRRARQQQLGRHAARRRPSCAASATLSVESGRAGPRRVEVSRCLLAARCACGSGPCTCPWQWASAAPHRPRQTLRLSFRPPAAKATYTAREPIPGVETSAAALPRDCQGRARQKERVGERPAPEGATPSATARATATVASTHASRSATHALQPGRPHAHVQPSGTPRPRTRPSRPVSLAPRPRPHAHFSPNLLPQTTGKRMTGRLPLSSCPQDATGAPARQQPRRRRWPPSRPGSECSQPLTATRTGTATSRPRHAHRVASTRARSVPRAQDAPRPMHTTRPASRLVSHPAHLRARKQLHGQEVPPRDDRNVKPRHTIAHNSARQHTGLGAAGALGRGTRNTELGAAQHA